MWNKKILLCTLCIGLHACSKVDDYLFGKDNTPRPMLLKEITPKFTFVENWSVGMGKANSSGLDLNLQIAIQDNVVYTASSAGLVHATDRRSGKALWVTKLGHGIVSGPNVADGYIVVGTDVTSVILLRQTDGAQLWQHNVSGEVLSKPLITSKKLIVKTIDGNVYAFDLLSGKKLWVYKHGTPNLILKTSSSPVKLGNLILVGFADGRLDALALQTGEMVWQRRVAYAKGASDIESLVDIDTDPIVRGDVIYLAGYQSSIGALSLPDGQFLWNKPASTYKNLAMNNTTLFMVDNTDVVCAFNRHNGELKWQQHALTGHGLTEPVLMGDRLILGDKTGYLHALSTIDGKQMARIQVYSPIITAPVIVGNHIYIITANGKLSAYSVHN